MLYLNLKPLLKARGITRPYTWLVKSGFPVAAAKRLSTDNYREVPLHYMEKLCLLLHCTPNDLLSWKPEEVIAEEHQLAILIPKDTTELEWIDELHRLPLEELRELGKKLKTERGQAVR